MEPGNQSLSRYILIVIGGLVVVAGVVSIAYMYMVRSVGNERTFSVSGVATEDISLAQKAFNSNDLDSALEIIQAVLAANPNDVDALVTKASILAQAGSLHFQEQDMAGQAIAVAQQALAINPNNDEAWRIIGYGNEIMQNYPAAHEAYARSLAINPQNALTLSQEAHAYDLQGDLGKAEAGYEAALAIDSQIDQAQMGRARIYVQNGDAAKALPIFAAEAHDAQNVHVRAEAAYSAGMIENALGRNTEASQWMNTATSLDPAYPLAWVGLGMVTFNSVIDKSMNLSREERSALLTSSFESLQKAINLNPNQAAAYYQMGVQMAAIGRSSVAIKFLNETSTIIPNDITLNAVDKEHFTTRTKTVLATLTP